MKNIFAGHANSYHGFDFEQTLDGISKAGFKYIELAAVLNWTEHVMSYMSEEELAEVVSKEVAKNLVSYLKEL